MARIGKKTRLWLRSFHTLVFAIWIGAALSATAIPFIKGDGELYTYFDAAQILDSFIIPAGVLTLVTGLLLTWFGGWGFFRHFFIIYSIIIVIVAIVVGAAILAPSIKELKTIAESQGIQALNNPDYQQIWQRYEIASIIQPILLVSAVFVSVLKPFSQRHAVSSSS